MEVFECSSIIIFALMAYKLWLLTALLDNVLYVLKIKCIRDRIQILCICALIICLINSLIYSINIRPIYSAIYHLSLQTLYLHYKAQRNIYIDASMLQAICSF